MGLYEHFPYSNYHELNLDWILSKVKELQENIDEINNWKETFSAQINSQISDLINQVNTEFNQLKADIEKEFTDYRTETDAKFASLTDAINERLTGFDGRIADIESKLSDIETNLPTLVHVTNPYTGMSDSIQNVINALADTQRSDALTASAYDALKLTAAAYDAKNVSAADYDFHGQSFIG